MKKKTNNFLSLYHTSLENGRGERCRLRETRQCVKQNNGAQYHDTKIKTVTWEVTWMADHDMGEACLHTARIYVEVTTIFDSIDSTGYMLPVAVT